MGPKNAVCGTIVGVVTETNTCSVGNVKLRQEGGCVPIRTCLITLASSPGLIILVKKLANLGTVGHNDRPRVFMADHCNTTYGRWPMSACNFDLLGTRTLRFECYLLCYAHVLTRHIPIMLCFPAYACHYAHSMQCRQKNIINFRRHCNDLRNSNLA